METVVKKEEVVLKPVSEELFYFGDFTVARVKETAPTLFGDKVFQGIGISRQSKEDRRDVKKGNLIALGRAKKAVRMKVDGKIIKQPYMA